MSNRFRLEELFNLADRDIKDGHFESAFRRLEEILVEDPLFWESMQLHGVDV